MNIFVTDLDPFQSARNLCDAHVIKMIVESCQLLSTQDRLHGLTGFRYKATHINHPCRKCLENPFNYIWLQYHLYGLCKEYTYRFGKIHKSQTLLNNYWLRPDSEDIFNSNSFIENYSELLDATSFPQCVKNSYSNESMDISVVYQIYRSYYKTKKETMKRFKYTNRVKPIWL